MTLVHEIRKALNKKNYGCIKFCPGFSSDGKSEDCDMVYYVNNLKKEHWESFNLNNEEKKKLNSVLCPKHFIKHKEYAIKKYNIH